jgi:hypothetical protein
MPTFMIFKHSEVVSTIRGADPKALSDAVSKLAKEAESSGSGGFEAGASSSGTWLGASLSRGYSDVTGEIDVKGLDLLNADSDFGTARTLFDASQPSGTATIEAAKGKGKASASQPETKADWIESDTDEQLMLYIPFMSTLKVHTLQITSMPPTPTEDNEEPPMRPKTINIYSNRAHVLGFNEAEDIPAVQSITLGPRDWDEKTGTAKMELRFVKFQNVTSLVLFVVDGDGESEKVRIDRIRVIGDSGEKRALGKLEKIGDEPGE